jgi:hypothetical protein|tara:strand:+ start:16 stop:687 length:672 start_codon:yes stop_codon:yes gene_type:complete
MKSFLKQINESFQALDEKAAKPDYLDFDGDGDKEEAMTKALKDKEQNEDVDSKADLDDDGELSSWEKARKDAIDKAMDKEVDEISTSAGAGAYMTKNFVAKRKQTNPNLKQSTGYTDVPKTKLHSEYDRVQEAMDRKYEQLIEGYREFALGNGKRSPNQTVNSAIREVAKKLKEIEETVKYTGRLKTESGISHSGFSSGTHNALRKISERLIKISERVRSLGE